jgi:hypothetical protein
VRDRTVVVKAPKKSGKVNGIQTKLVTEGGKSGCPIKFTVWVTSTCKYKQLWQRTGVIVKALSAQEATSAGIRTAGLLGVRVGDNLQIESRVQGVEYEATNLRTKRSGIVRIAALVVLGYNKPEEEFEIRTGESWSPGSSTASTPNAIQKAVAMDPSYVPPHARYLLPHQVEATPNAIKKVVAMDPSYVPPDA